LSGTSAPGGSFAASIRPSSARSSGICANGSSHPAIRAASADHSDAAQNTVGRSEVQSFAGSLDGVGATKGIFVTTSSFSQGAREFVARIAKRIVLVDGAELARLMVLHSVGVRTRTVYELKKVDEDYFTE
jgi:restriction endonuclease Mrr